jgi:hypothetical protein
MATNSVTPKPEPGQPPTTHNGPVAAPTPGLLPPPAGYPIPAADVSLVSNPNYCDGFFHATGPSGGPYTPNCDLGHDGQLQAPVTNQRKGPAEFADEDVIELNGIDTTWSQQQSDMQYMANLLHQPVRGIHVATTGDKVSDLAQFTLPEKVLAHDFPAEDQVAATVRKDLEAGKKVHFVAHSRGALVVERGLEKLHDSLRAEGKSEPEVAAMLSNVSVETYGGAAKSFPPGVCALHYVDPLDPVANMFGAGKPNLGANLVLGGSAYHMADPLVDALDVSSEVSGLLSHPGGPTVSIPMHSLDGQSLDALSGLRYAALHPSDALTANHDFRWYARNSDHFDAMRETGSVEPRK